MTQFLHPNSPITVKQFVYRFQSLQLPFQLLFSLSICLLISLYILFSFSLFLSPVPFLVFFYPFHHYFTSALTLRNTSILLHNHIRYYCYSWKLPTSGFRRQREERFCQVVWVSLVCCFPFCVLLRS